MPSIVIIGAGHAGVQVAVSLREMSCHADILLLNDETHEPYQRPPLSKAYLKAGIGREALALRGPKYFADKRIELRSDSKVVKIDRKARRVICASGGEVTYDYLVLAVGARARKPTFEGGELESVLTLRSLSDAERLRSSLAGASECVVIGGGFIGLEFAATAALMGKAVTVVEASPRVMARAVSPIVSEFFAEAHERFGAVIRTSVTVETIRGDNGRVRCVHLSDGTVLPADLALLGIGVEAEDDLARQCGLDCRDGVLVDTSMRTSDPFIFAAGDCVRYPNVWSGSFDRLESIQNAVDQAKTIARCLSGQGTTYDALPWFWSDQGDLKLQIAGLLRNCDEYVVRGDRASRSFSVFAFSGENLCAVESINRGGDHMAGRLLLANRIPLSRQEVADPAFDLKARVTHRS